jgi:hypothetical protein
MVTLHEVNCRFTSLYIVINAITKCCKLIMKFPFPSVERCKLAWFLGDFGSAYGTVRSTKRNCSLCIIWPWIWNRCDKKNLDSISLEFVLRNRDCIGGPNDRTVWGTLTTRTLGSWIRTPLEAFMSAFFCVVLSCVGRELVTGRSPFQGVLIKCPKQVHKFQKSNSESV